MKRFAFVLAIWLVLGFHGKGYAAKKPEKSTSTGVTIVAKAESVVSGNLIHVGDIATIQGGSPALQQAIAAVVVGVAPLPGLSRSIMAGDILVHLREAQLANSSVHIKAPTMILVRRAANNVAANQIVQAALVAAQKAVQGITGAVLVPDPVEGNVVLPTGQLQIVAGQASGDPSLGTLFVPVSLCVDGKPVQATTVTFHVHRKLQALVANRTLEPRDILQPDDVSLVTVDLPPGFNDPITDAKEAIGKRATRRILAGAPIPASALEVPPVVQAGNIITVLYVVGQARITAYGTAQQSARVGDTIHVYITSTHKIIDAVVLDAHTAEVMDN
ncbi:MAG TPA: flagellar basal body P-ring formation chaperone FlgA [Chthonomonas sp.]|jgi:flagella basal body P-ring formation protein FlgA|uniref:flagellar basal body P-ring formation chaperone FlgA n=1 Tax=Chthonomonas sp. TaxID=2282153 RepID=UPI002B4B52F5|nr:flagellar basal body P-ring formation chaperone FlgA [Chthonomonas sp.]HLH81601.1 flagellar basal body P-ring formation chaperone FlgA [Chthonomonas sp.]